MNVRKLIQRLRASGHVPGSAATLRQAIAWAFIALVALFLTHPAAEQRGASDAPLPAERAPQPAAR